MEARKFFIGQPLQSFQWTATAKSLHKGESFEVNAYTQPSITKVATFPKELEAAPEPPMNTYKNKEPYIGTIKSVERIVGPKAPGETCHIVIDHDGNVPYWEGQSYGIIPPVSLDSTYYGLTICIKYVLHPLYDEVNGSVRQMVIATFDDGMMWCFN